MKNFLPKPRKKQMIYEDNRLYVCLANFPITKGHLIVAWKKRVTDLSLLDKKDYQYLMGIVDRTRNALIKSLKVKKVYLIYMDEINQVHWHLVPRYDEKGFNMLNHSPKKLKDFGLVETIKKTL